MRTLNCSMWDLVPWPGIEPRVPALGAQSLTCWNTWKSLFYKSGSSPRWGGHLKMLWRAQALPVFLLHSPLHVAVILIVSRSCISAWLKEHSSWVPPYLPRNPAQTCTCVLISSYKRAWKDCFAFLKFIFACTGSALLHGLSLVAGSRGYSHAAWASLQWLSCFRTQV